MCIKVISILNSASALTPSDGDKLYKILNRQLNINKIFDEKDIIIDFSGLKFITTAFINQSIFKIITNNRTIVDSIKFIDSSNNDNKLSDSIKRRLDRCIELALDDNLREAHNKALDDVLSGNID